MAVRRQGPTPAFYCRHVRDVLPNTNPSIMAEQGYTRIHPAKMSPKTHKKTGNTLPEMYYLFASVARERLELSTS